MKQNHFNAKIDAKMCASSSNEAVDDRQGYRKTNLILTKLTFKFSKILKSLNKKHQVHDKLL